MYQPAQQAPAPIPAQPRNGMGITALVLAVVGVLFGLVPLTGYVAIILGVLGIIFGLIGFSRSRRGLASNPKMSAIASGIAVIAIALGIWGLVIDANAVHQLNNDLNNIQTSLNNIPAPTFPTGP